MTRSATGPIFSAKEEHARARRRKELKERSDIFQIKRKDELNLKEGWKD
jgi:hypothetical protein